MTRAAVLRAVLVNSVHAELLCACQDVLWIKWCECRKRSKSAIVSWALGTLRTNRDHALMQYQVGACLRSILMFRLQAEQLNWEHSQELSSEQLATLQHRCVRHALCQTSTEYAGRLDTEVTTRQCAEEERKSTEEQYALVHKMLLTWK